MGDSTAPSIDRGEVVLLKYRGLPIIGSLALALARIARPQYEQSGGDQEKCQPIQPRCRFVPVVHVNTP